ncbi:uncharacterized protein LOC112564697 isoform X3 [Pomacea canaliculata]|uniref:uncharacterized protein LOC112564697 isoform X3 n=1 Tax=Pomacea canaliculata TaxID=400727 RepID=UPI000D73A941|nr:uncharacterized protein LOC112564697 isoform X3 [Pomacea canaliculata]
MELSETSTPPPETDLDYYSRPENYAGSDFTTLQRFVFARDKELQDGRGASRNERGKKVGNEDELYRRHKLSGSLAGDDSEGDSNIKPDSTRSTSHMQSPNKIHLPSISNSDYTRPDKQRLGVPGLEQSLQTERRPLPSRTESLPHPPNIRGRGRNLPPLDQRLSSKLSSKSVSRCSDSSSESGAVGYDTSVLSHEHLHGAAGHTRRGRNFARRKLSPHSPDVTSYQIKKRFQRAIKAVMTIRKLATLMIKKSEEPSAMLKSFNDIIELADNFNENLKNQGLSFDPSYFKAHKEISVSSEVKNILSMPPSFRSQEQIQTAMYGLQSLPSFAEYPLHMQEKLAKVAWYEVVPPKRTIIRQGHYAENFYFILSGQAVVTILIRDPKTGESHVRTANFMRKGTSFGELALLHRSRRTATVTSHDTVQLLSIGRDDFFDIFMARHGADDVPEHIRFVSQLDFLKGWPIDRLLERPEFCLLHFFKRNMVIVKDSKQSEWIYIVKSGSCQVLKQLQAVTARLDTRRYIVPEDDIFNLPHTGTAARGPKIDTGIRRRRPKPNGFHLLHHYRSEEEALNGENLPKLAENEKLGALVTRESQLLRGNRLLEQSSSSHDPPAARKFSKKNYMETLTTGKAHFTVLAPRASVGPPQRSRAKKVKRQQGLSLSAPPGHPSVFVQVELLKPRDAFGLQPIQFPDDLDAPQTSVSLVSESQTDCEF